MLAVTALRMKFSSSTIFIGTRFDHNLPMKNKKVVVFFGPKLSLPGKAPGHQEFDFVIVDLDLKALIRIESKQTLNRKTGVLFEAEEIIHI